MIGIGTIINCVAVVIGGLIGLFLKNLFSKNMQIGLKRACGVCVIFISISSAMEKMLKISGSELISEKSMLIIVCMTLGTFIGELINIDGRFQCFGEFLKNKTGNKGDNDFINAFLTASFTTCIGAMTIIGPLEDALRGDLTILVIKSILDFIMVAVLTSSIGKGAIYSAIPIFIFEGAITLLASFISPFINDLIINYISLIGSVLIFCVGINLIWDNIIKVANILPSIILAIIFAGFNLF